MTNRQKSISILEEINAPFYILEHSKDVYTCSETATERKVSLDEVVKTLVCYDKRKNIHLFLIPGSRELDHKKARRWIQSNKMRFVQADILEREFGLVIGAISPLLMIGKGHFHMDKHLSEKELVTISTGEPGSGIKLHSIDLIQLVQCDISELT